MPQTVRYTKLERFCELANSFKPGYSDCFQKGLAVKSFQNYLKLTKRWTIADDIAVQLCKLKTNLCPYFYNVAQKLINLLKRFAKSFHSYRVEILKFYQFLKYMKHAYLKSKLYIKRWDKYFYYLIQRSLSLYFYEINFFCNKMNR